jgi:hypothetical protein
VNEGIEESILMWKSSVVKWATEGVGYQYGAMEGRKEGRKICRGPIDTENEHLLV